MSAPTVAPAASRPHLTVGGQQIPVVLPNRRDPRLKLSAVIITLHVLGQTVLGFKVSIAQILVTMLVCGLIDAAVTFRSGRMLVWPASGILTGSSIAFILRASGTRHGDWWSLHGIQFFVLAGVISLLSKHLVRPTGRHLFNPSNVGIVWCLLVVGPNHVFAQYLWWGPNHAGVAFAYAVIAFGAFWILRSVRMIPMAVSFLATFAVLMGIFALVGRSFFAIWHVGPIQGLSYWATIALSPEVLVFVFFMISDPQTAPKVPSARVIYGAAVAVVAAALLFFQHTEFGIKVSILSSLTVVCAVVPFLEAAVRHRQLQRALAADGAGAGTDAPPEAEPPRVPVPSRPPLVTVLARLRRPAVAAAVVIALAAPVDTALLARNRQALLIERGEVGKANAQ
ncbi:MAG TPA: RnfABCDGE type electron transport complex subunit D [Acidimicrobiales bacterium]|nr:RnfABCDGE type electron transport complex subunit D [Acidimicrobiales bacterium]